MAGGIVARSVRILKGTLLKELEGINLRVLALVVGHVKVTCRTEGAYERPKTAGASTQCDVLQIHASLSLHLCESIDL